MRRLVWASLPLGRGKILDPFCGAGSTLAAADALGYDSVGVEMHRDYYHLALSAIPKLSALKLDQLNVNGSAIRKASKYQSVLFSNDIPTL